MVQSRSTASSRAIQPRETPVMIAMTPKPVPPVVQASWP